MKKTKIQIFIAVCLLFYAIAVASCSKETTQASPENTQLVKTQNISDKSVENYDLKKFYDKYNVTGCFVLYDKNKNEFVHYNPKRCAEKFVPASTFKIPNTLIALETGVMKDENSQLKWDGVKRERAEWNKDQTLDSAFKVSAFWFYQEIARHVGEERMQKYVNDFNYGNRDTSGGLDQFWLRGNMRISPDEQIAFLRKLYENKLPVSEHSTNILKKIMLIETGENYKLFAKTGAGRQNEKLIGWYVGFIEQKGNVYYFASNIEADNRNRKFMPARIEAAKQILTELGLLMTKERVKQ